MHTHIRVKGVFVFIFQSVCHENIRKSLIRRLYDSVTPIYNMHTHRLYYTRLVGPISYIRSKFTRMSPHSGANFVVNEVYPWSLRSTAPSGMHI